MAALLNNSPTFDPGFGPRFLGTLKSPASLFDWTVCGAKPEALSPRAPLTFTFPGFRPLWPGGRPTEGLGCMAWLSTLPSVNPPTDFGNTAAGTKHKKTQETNESSCDLRSTLVTWFYQYAVSVSTNLFSSKYMVQDSLTYYNLCSSVILQNIPYWLLTLQRAENCLKQPFVNTRVQKRTRRKTFLSKYIFKKRIIRELTVNMICD